MYSLEPCHGGLINSGVHMLAQHLKTSIHVTMKASLHGVKSSSHLMPKLLTLALLHLHKI